MHPRLEIRDIRRAYEGRFVVDGVSLKVAPGQVTCLLGPSGCGKSTTLRIISGVETQDSGEVYSDGALICDATTRVPPEKRAIGMMFQDFALFPHLSVARNVGFGLPRGGADHQARITELLERVGLAHYANSYPHQLSGGEQQRVALARALAPRPKIMLMDEPFSGLDNRLRDGIRDQTLDLLKDAGAAVLLVTHEPEEAMRMADEIALMQNGKIVQKGAPYEIYNSPVNKRSAAFFSDINVIGGVVKAGMAQTPFGAFAAPDLAEGCPVEVISRPQHIGIHTDDIKGDDAVQAYVTRARFIGTESLIEFRLQDETMLKASVPDVFLPEIGSAFWLSLPRDHCFVFAKDD
ncbi:MAG: Fe3+/spermidine/putrescine ABC transporter ATP-binding protein [Rhodobacterales bacterium]|nr:MAG: Fe3+/spermidine/putrescine ABC transporter ATP-binding protein [Rhodobacterales bacterium]